MIDVQAPFLKSLQNPEALLQRCRFTVEAAQLLEIPVYYTTQLEAKLGPLVPELTDLSPTAPVIDKMHFSCMGCMDFSQQLAADNIQHVLICGLEIAVCVYQTTLDLLAADYSVTLLRDALDGRRPADSETVMRYLENRTQAHILPTESVFYSLVRHSAHPAMRAYTRLVKEYNR